MKITSRAEALPRILFDQTIVQMRRGMADGMMQPRFLLDEVVTQANGIATQGPISPFAHPFRFSETPSLMPIASGCATRIWPRFKDSVLPAYVQVY
jgi:uncharacterized protein (DUF885 family)